MRTIPPTPTPYLAHVDSTPPTVPQTGDSSDTTPTPLTPEEQAILLTPDYSSTTYPRFDSNGQVIAYTNTRVATSTPTTLNLGTPCLHCRRTTTKGRFCSAGCRTVYEGIPYLLEESTEVTARKVTKCVNCKLTHCFPNCPACGRSK